MDQESIVYGCIKDLAFDVDDPRGEQRRSVNREVMLALPSVDEWPVLSKEMFSIPGERARHQEYQTEVLHFGASYRAIEYEWDQWIARFEEMLGKMYWVSVTVHLETELHGVHTFNWESTGSCHEPNTGSLSMRCEWSREGSVFA
jgi:hypothetical protein